jgi:hypothetical protein
MEGIKWLRDGPSLKACKAGRPVVRSRTRTAAVLGVPVALGAALFVLVRRRGIGVWARNQRMLLEEPRHLFGGLGGPEEVLAYLSCGGRGTSR